MWRYGVLTGKEEEQILRAVCLSDLITIHQKTGIGRLSAYCGAVSAGVGAGCGIAWLRGADYDAISHTLENAVAMISGCICDGAKAQQAVPTVLDGSGEAHPYYVRTSAPDAWLGGGHLACALSVEALTADLLRDAGLGQEAACRRPRLLHRRYPIKHAESRNNGSLRTFKQIFISCSNISPFPHHGEHRHAAQHGTRQAHLVHRTRERNTP